MAQKYINVRKRTRFHDRAAVVFVHEDAENTLRIFQTMLCSECSTPMLVHSGGRFYAVHDEGCQAALDGPTPRLFLQWPDDKALVTEIRQLYKDDMIGKGVKEVDINAVIERHRREEAARALG